MNPIKALQAKWRACASEIRKIVHHNNTWHAQGITECADELSPLAEQWERDTVLIQRLENELGLMRMYHGTAGDREELVLKILVEARARVKL